MRMSASTPARIRRNADEQHEEPKSRIRTGLRVLKSASLYSYVLTHIDVCNDFDHSLTRGCGCPKTHRDAILRHTKIPSMIIVLSVEIFKKFLGLPGHYIFGFVIIFDWSLKIIMHYYW